MLQTAGECDELGVEHNVCLGEVHIVENRVPVIQHSELGLIQRWDLSAGREKFRDPAWVLSEYVLSPIRAYGLKNFSLVYPLISQADVIQQLQPYIK